MQKPKHHIFICASTRLNGKVQGVCEKKKSHNLIQLFTEGILDQELDGDIMVTATGCNKGPVIMIYPEQIWYCEVSEDDVDEIIDTLISGGVVDRLLI